MQELWPIEPAAYTPHPLHRTELVWPQSNCYVDLWIELLHTFGVEQLVVKRARRNRAASDGHDLLFLVHEQHRRVGRQDAVVADHQGCAVRIAQVPAHRIR